MENKQPGIVIFKDISEGRMRLQVVPSEKEGGASQLLMEIVRARQEGEEIIVDWKECLELRLPGPSVAHFCALHQGSDQPDIRAEEQTGAKTKRLLSVQPSKAPGVLAWRLAYKENGEDKKSVSMRLPKTKSDMLVVAMQAALPMLLGWGGGLAGKAIEKEEVNVQEAATQLVQDFFDGEDGAEA